MWLVLPGGKKVVLTARVHKPLFGPAEGELVLLEMPQVLFISCFEDGVVFIFLGWSCFFSEFYVCSSTSTNRTWEVT